MSSSRFWDLLEKSVIFQGLLTLIVVGAYLYLLIAGRPVPPFLEGVVGLIVGFFFGGKVSSAVTETVRQVNQLRGRGE